MRKINKQGLELIKHFESLKLEAYKDVVGVWTIGWGHTGEDVYEGLVITEEQAEELLKKDLEEYERYVRGSIGTRLNDNQFSALVSFAYNLGIGNLKTSTLLKLLNKGDYFNASKEFVKWSKAGGKRYKGLVRRRLSERNLFCSFNNLIVENKNMPNNWESVYLEL